MRYPCGIKTAHTRRCTPVSYTHLYLLKFGNTEFPNNYFAEYSSTPDQRMDNDAERDDNGSLQRSTLPTGKTSITFSTHILHLNEKINMQNIINSGIVNTVQRKMCLRDRENRAKIAKLHLSFADLSTLIRPATAVSYTHLI